MTTERRKFARGLRKGMTPAEDVLWQALRGCRFQGLKFRRQVPLLNYTVDFLCVERKLVVEVDGRQHNWYADYDRTRTDDIERNGFHVIRFTNDAVLNDLDDVLTTISKAAAMPAIEHPHPRPLSQTGEGR